MCDRGEEISTVLGTKLKGMGKASHSLPFQEGVYVSRHWEAPVPTGRQRERDAAAHAGSSAAREELRRAEGGGAGGMLSIDFPSS